jgi:putative ABC transport system permease protein
VFRRDCLSREIDEEFESHIAEAVEHGRNPVKARRAFGPTLRKLKRAAMPTSFGGSIHSAPASSLVGASSIKIKVTSATAILSLALAIGACTSAFRLIDALLPRPLPVAEPERIHVVAFPGAGADLRPQQ